MSPDRQLDSPLDRIGRASRRAALLSFLGFLLVVGAIAYAYASLSGLQDRQQRLLAETEQSQQKLATVNTELARSRASLASARAAINAFHEGRLQDAVALYDEALASDPGNAYIQNLRAYALFQLGRVDEAIRAQRQSIAADPRYAWGYFDLARFLYAASPSRVEEAQQAEAKAIHLRGDMPRIMERDGEFQRLRRLRLRQANLPEAPAGTVPRTIPRAPATVRRIGR